MQNEITIGVLNRFRAESRFLFQVARLLTGYLVMSTVVAEYYVDAGAEGGGTGSMDRPFSTIQQAAEILQPGDVCLVRGGVYRETIAPANSGSAEVPIVFSAYRGEKVTITGLEKVQGWKHDHGDIFVADLELGRGHGNQVFADGRMMLEARWPDAAGNFPEYLLEFPKASMGKGTTPTRIVDRDLPEKNWAGATAWIASGKRWFCWTGSVTGHGKGFVTVENNADSKGNHECAKGGEYYLFGVRDALDAANEWFYDRDSRQLYAWVPGGGNPGDRVEVKRRSWAFDLRGRAHVTIRNINLMGGSVATDRESDCICLEGLRVLYPYHSSRAERQYGSQAGSGIVLKGAGHIVRNCEIAYSSGNGLTLAGRDFRVVNSYIHDCDYIGSYAAPLVFSRGSSGHVVSHNTITRAGRSCISTPGFYDCLLQYNDVSLAGYLTFDLGLTYGNGVEGGNSEIRYNWFRDNVSGSHNMGLYFDHGCKNIIFHHNLISGATRAGIINNQYGNYLLYYNNTVAGVDPSYLSAWAAGQKKDLYGCRLINNVGTGGTRIKGNGLEMTNNTWNYDELVQGRFLTPGTEPVDSGLPVQGVTDDWVGNAPDRGAYELGGVKWKPGHDFSHSPAEIETRRARPPHRNFIRNSAFYRGESDHWRFIGGNVEVVADGHSQWITDAKTMMGGYSVCLGPGKNAVEQAVRDLAPETTYELMGMFRVDGDAEACLDIETDRHGKKRSKSISGTQSEWQRLTLRFTSGPGRNEVRVGARNLSGGSGRVYVDDMGLQMLEQQ